MSARAVAVVSGRALTFLLVALASCAERAAGPPPRPPVPVEVIDVAPRDLVARYTEMATLGATEVVTVSAEVAGRIAALPKDEGDSVTAGEAVVRLDDEIARARLAEAAARVAQAQAKHPQLAARIEQEQKQIAQAEATLRQVTAQLDAARTNFQRKEALFRGKATSEAVHQQAKDDLAVAEARVQEAQAGIAWAQAAAEARSSETAAIEADLKGANAAVEVARATLARHVVAAPVAGVVMWRGKEPGEMVQPGEAVLRIAPTDPLRAVVSLPERIAMRVRTGDEVTVHTDGAERAGRVFRVAPLVDPATRTVKIEADVPNPDRGIRVGAFGRVTFVLDRRERVPAVPVQVIRREATGEAFVLVLLPAEGGHVTERRDVRLGLEADGWVEVTEGLRPGETIVSLGAKTLAGGARVQPVRPEPAPAETER